MKHFQFLLILAAIGLVTSACPRPARAFQERPIYIADTAEARAGQKQFSALWQQRSQPPIAGQPTLAMQLLPFLDDPFIGLRIRAAKALGELQDPIAQAPLEARLAQIKATPPGQAVDRAIDIPPLTLQLALGHIAARSLHGQAKLDAALSYTKSKWADVVATSKIANASDDIYSWSDDTLAFVVDVLYEMGKSGEPIDEWTSQLTLTRAQKVWMKAASLSTKDEVQLEMEFLVDTQVYVHRYQKDGQELTQHLATLGPDAIDAMVVRLEDMKEHPDSYYGKEFDPDKSGNYYERMKYSALFSIVPLTPEPRLLALFKYFEQLDDPEISQSAAWHLWALEGFANNSEHEAKAQR